MAKMTFWRFIWFSIKIHGKRSNEAAATVKSHAIAGAIGDGAMRPEDAGGHAESFFTQSLQYLLVIPLFVAGLAGNMLAGAIAHFAEAGFDLNTTVSRAEAILGGVSIALLLYTVAWAYGLYNRYQWLGVGTTHGAGGHLR